MSAPIRNTMLVANAGSGKTYALTTRMVKLLVLGGGAPQDRGAYLHQEGRWGIP